VTGIVRTDALPDLRHGGSARRITLSLGSAVVWAVAAIMLATGLVPEIDGTETELSIRATYLALGLLVASVPLVCVYLPQRRLVHRFVAAALAVPADRPAVPAVTAWQGPQRMFQRLRWTAYSAVSVPLLCLLISLVLYGIVLDDTAGFLVSLIFLVPPVGGLLATATTTRRQLASVSAGLAAGQVVPVTVDKRIDQKLVINDAFRSWFEARLPDGQRLLLRTPMHFTWATEARGVVDAPDLVLVIGRSGHQGALVAPSRPEDAIWLLGPVPQVRVPRSILKAFATDG